VPLTPGGRSITSIEHRTPARLVVGQLIDFITSLDGYGAAEGWPGWWGLEGHQIHAHLGQPHPVPLDGRLQLLEYVPTVLAGPPGTTKADA
jgi:hypothetical protein